MDRTYHFGDPFIDVRVILKYISRNNLQCFDKTITQRIFMVTPHKSGYIIYIYIYIYILVLSCF
jgi:hypothetical protein